MFNMQVHGRTIQSLALCALSLVFLLWPAIYNGQPIYFADSSAYVRGASVATKALTGVEGRWVETATPAKPKVQLYSDKTSADTTKQGALLSEPESTPLLGRSIYYGLLLWLGDAFADQLSAAIFQAFVVLAVLGFTLANFGIFTGSNLWLMAAALALVTPLAFFTSFLMPDVFSGVAVLAALNLVLFYKRMSWWALIFFFVAGTYAALVHSTHVLLELALAVAAFIIWMLRPSQIQFKGIAILALCALFGLIGEFVFAKAVLHATGKSAVRPPFVAARLIADGPGLTYLQNTCNEPQFVLCEFLPRLVAENGKAYVNSDQILWGGEGKAGIFASAPYSAKLKLGQEQLRFAIRVFASDPFGVIFAVLKNTFRQLGMNGLSEFNYNVADLDYFQKKMPAELWQKTKTTPAARQNMPVGLFSFLTTLSALLSLAFLAFAFIKGRDGYNDQSVRLFAVLIGASILVNAGICGALSTPHDRYGARLIWLLPALVLFIELSARRRSFGKAHGETQ